MNELNQVFIELDSKHFTAVTLRTGRLWEAIIYAIAKFFNIDLHSFRGLKPLEDQIKRELRRSMDIPLQINNRIRYIREIRNKSAHPSRTQEIQESSINEAELAIRFVQEVLYYLLERIKDY